MSQAPPRPGKRERTREALIDATLAVIEETGFAGASLEAIAERAGMSRGAIYSNFKGRSELLIAAFTRIGLKIDRTFAPAESLKAQLRVFSDSLIATLPKAPGIGTLHAEFYHHTLTDPDLRATIAKEFTEGFAAIGAQLAAQHQGRLAIAGNTLAWSIQALAMGFVYQAILAPGTLSDSMVREAFDALADGAVRQ
ncbi:MAG: TetR family transcriptional regulator [Caulobacteraceae bacterium]